MENAATNGKTFGQTLSEVIVSWDFVDDGGKPFPVTAEVIEAYFGIPTQGRILRALVAGEAVAPN